MLERQKREVEVEGRSLSDEAWKLRKELSKKSGDLRGSLDRICDLEIVQTTVLSVGMGMSDLEINVRNLKAEFEKYEQKKVVAESALATS